MNKEKILNMTTFAVFASFIIVLGLVPNIGYITVIPGIASLTIVHIPVLIGIMFLPLFYSLGLGLTFGLTSLIASFMYARWPFDYAFQNPLISVIPRILFSLAAFYIFKGFKTLFSKVKNGNFYSLIIIIVITVVFFYFSSIGLAEVTGWDLNILYVIFGLMLITLLILYYYFLRKDRYKNLAYIPAVFITSTLIHSLIVFLFVAILKPSAYGESADILGIILTALSTNSLFEALIAVLIGSPVVVSLYNLIEKEVNDHDLNV